nr:immunoglobulin heavy chain junction region [Mus musculus]
CARDRDGMDYW